MTTPSPQLTVKIYYQENGVNKEIRKFSLDEEMVTNYEYLMGKIKLYFSSLLRKDLELFWKDADNDLILMSSDEELFELLKTVRCDADCLKLYIKEKAPPATPEPVGDAHPGIICDGCDKSIIGLRYICTVCPNFDLCEACEKKGTHPMDHDMLCIKKPKPTSSTSFQMPPFFSVNSSVNGGPWQSFSSHQSGQQTDSNSKSSNAKGKDSTTNAKPNQCPKSPFTPPFHHPPPFHAPPPFHPPPFHAPFNPQFGQFSTSFGVNPSAAAGCAASAAQSVFTQPQTTSTSTSSTSSSSSTSTGGGGSCGMGFNMGNHFAQHMAQNLANNPNGLAHMTDHIAKSVGEQFSNNPEFVSQLLNPLFAGTAASQQTQGGNPTNTSNPTNGAANPDQIARNMAQSFATNPEFISGVMKTFFGGSPNTTQQQGQQQQQQQQQQNQNMQQQQQQQQQHQSSEAPMPDEVCGDNGNVVNDDSQKNGNESVVLPTDAEVDDSSSHLKYDPVAKTYVVIDKEDKPTELTEEEAYEQKLDDAIRHMTSMGFDNENGWLKQLLISKDLDIGRVLDALKPPFN